MHGFGRNMRVDKNPRTHPCGCHKGDCCSFLFSDLFAYTGDRLPELISLLERRLFLALRRPIEGATFSRNFVVCSSFISHCVCLLRGSETSCNFVRPSDCNSTDIPSRDTNPYALTCARTNTFIHIYMCMSSSVEARYRCDIIGFN